MESGNVPETKSHVEVVDFLRGIAVLLVFFYHCKTLLIPNGQLLNLEHLSIRNFILLCCPFSFGWSGVQLFLLISGFVIHQSTHRSIDFKGFFTRRIFRIYPLYLIFLLFYFGFEGNVFSIKDFLLHFFLLNNLFDDTFFTIGPQFWSLGLEFQLYLLYYLFYPFLNRNFSLTFGIGTFLALVSVVFLLLQRSESPAINNSVLVLWPVWLAGADLSNRYRQSKLIPFNRWALLAFFLLIKLFEVMALPGLLFPLLYSLLYYGLFSELLRQPRMGGIAKQISYLGLISYGIYLSHVAILKIVPALSLFNLTNISGWFALLDIAVALLLTVMVSDFLFRNVELPFIQKGRNLMKKYFPTG